MGSARSALPETHPPEHFRFSHPEEVVAYRDFSQEQKCRILLDWLQDEFALLVADYEGMVGGRSPRPDQVQAALQTLGQANEAWNRSPWPAM